MTGHDTKGPTPNPLPEQDGRGAPGGGLGLGVQFGAAIILCVLAGNWIDGHYATKPWGVLIGAIVGFAAGFYSIFRAAKSADADAAESQRRRGPGSGER